MGLPIFEQPYVRAIGILWVTLGWMGWDHSNFAQIRPVYAMMNPGALVAGKGNALVRIAYLRVCQMLRALVRGDPGGGDYPCP